MRRTSQRRAIMLTLEEAEGPLTPQEILDRAGAHHDTLGLATVYRNLNTLEAAGEVVSVHLPNDATRYEVAGRAHHHHFRCDVCRTVYELDTTCPVAVLEGVTLPGGYEVRGHALTLYGVCPECRTLSHA
jgi:Fur family transcriptional regulator, ferric uptake regulator